MSVKKGASVQLGSAKDSGSPSSPERNKTFRAVQMTVEEAPVVVPGASTLTFRCRTRKPLALIFAVFSFTGFHPLASFTSSQARRAETWRLLFQILYFPCLWGAKSSWTSAPLVSTRIADRPRPRQLWNLLFRQPVSCFGSLPSFAEPLPLYDSLVLDGEQKKAKNRGDKSNRELRRIKRLEALLSSLIA